MTDEELVEHILDEIEDHAGRFMYYDRKEDKDLPVGTIERLILDGKITVDMITQAFGKVIRDTVVRSMK